jgi:hypothetical protein
MVLAVAGVREGTTAVTVFDCGRRKGGEGCCC